MRSRFSSLRLIVRLVLVPDGADFQQLRDRGMHRGAVESVGQRLRDASLSEPLVGHDAQHRGRRLVQREDRGAGHQVQKIASGGLKQMKLPSSERDHRLTSA